jgi:hypothetical protein
VESKHYNEDLGNTRPESYRRGNGAGVCVFVYRGEGYGLTGTYSLIVDTLHTSTLATVMRCASCISNARRHLMHFLKCCDKNSRTSIPPLPTLLPPQDDDISSDGGSATGGGGEGEDSDHDEEMAREERLRAKMVIHCNIRCKYTSSRRPELSNVARNFSACE